VITKEKHNKIKNKQKKLVSASSKEKEKHSPGLLLIPLIILLSVSSFCILNVPLFPGISPTPVAFRKAKMISGCALG
jgi:hypothetical protein